MPVKLTIKEIKQKLKYNDHYLIEFIKNSGMSSGKTEINTRIMVFAMSHRNSRFYKLKRFFFRLFCMHDYKVITELKGVGKAPDQTVQRCEKCGQEITLPKDNNVVPLLYNPFDHF